MRVKAACFRGGESLEAAMGNKEDIFPTSRPSNLSCKGEKRATVREGSSIIREDPGFSWTQSNKVKEILTEKVEDKEICYPLTVGSRGHSGDGKE